MFQGYVGQIQECWKEDCIFEQWLNPGLVALHNIRIAVYYSI